jgi:hypothetical protein
MKENKRKYWSESEINLLIENYSDNFNSELVKILNRSESSIYNMANNLGLKKSKTHISKCISKRNKMVGRDLTYDLIVNIAKKYKTRSELQKKDPSVYTSLRRNGLLDEACSHMVIKNFSIPQIILKKIIEVLVTNDVTYNDRSVLNPYEIDVYLPTLKLGFEYNGKGWHKDNLNDVKKRKIADNLGITIITISERNRNYIDDIKTQLKENLKQISLLCNKEINESDVDLVDIGDVYSEIYSKEDLKKIVDNYTSFKEFYNNEKTVYRIVSKLGLIDEYTKNMCCRRKKRNESEVIEIINKYTYLGDLIKSDPSTYQFVMKNKLYHLIKHLKRKIN